MSSNRNLSSIARITTRLKSQKFDERRTRTRTLIQAGGLLSLTGLLEICGIQEGEDLQHDIQSHEKAATLLGILVEISETVLKANDPQQMEQFRKRGTTLLKQSAAKQSYQNQKII